MNVASGILLQRVSVSRFMIEPKNGPVQGVTRRLTQSGTRDRAGQGYTVCNQFTMNDVEKAGTRLQADASILWGNEMDAYENRIPLGGLYQATCLLGSPIDSDLLW